MPKMRWTHEADLQLLTGLIQTIDHVLDYDKIAATWPADAEVRPTPRAVKERLSKIKDMAKSAGPGGLTSPTATPSSKGKGESNAQPSPRKRSRTTPTKKKKDEPIETDEDEADNAEDDQPASDEC